jgi:hypothetical protein
MALPTAASVVSTGLAGYPTIYYDRVALDTLVSNLWFYPACDLKTMPDMSGVAMQVFDYTAPVVYPVNNSVMQTTGITTTATEGTPGAGEALTQNIATINLGNYVNSKALAASAGR